jgi:hypothetical protein
MPFLNLFLDADVEIKPSDPDFETSLIAKELQLRTKKQKHALHCVLSNIGKYRSQPILFNLRNQANPPSEYNPHGYGHKPIIAVLERLNERGLLTLSRGVPWLRRIGDTDEYEEKKLSEFKASEKLVSICHELGYTAIATANNTEGFLELRPPKKKKKLRFKQTPYAVYTNDLMAELCLLLNEHSFEVDGEDLGYIHLIRKYSDWDKSGELKFGGRCWLPYMSFTPEKRGRIRIDGKPTVAVDYPASLLNVVYKYETGRFCYPEDPYEVEGISRSTVKFLCTIMLNTDSIRAASSAANKNAEIKLEPYELDLFLTDCERFGNVSTVMKQIVRRNAPIESCFFNGKPQGQRYAWLETNLVFEVARQLARTGVPALTVHDEFIVPADKENAVLEYRYTTAFQDLW